MSVGEGEVLWEPSVARISSSNLSAFSSWLERERELTFSGYADLWNWSVGRLDEFWAALWDYFELGKAEHELAGAKVVESGHGAEGATWFPGRRLNYVDRVLRQAPDRVALICCDEEGRREEITFGELSGLVAAAAAGLRNLGVGRGDRVAAVLPNGAHAIVAFLATASLGAVWSSCAPEFGAPSMVDRFVQIDPKVLVAASGYSFRGRRHDITEKVADLESALPSLLCTVIVPRGADVWGHKEIAKDGRGRRIGWDELLVTSEPLVPVEVDFSHPLWILYSSGTTGLPKPIVHGHGGIVLEHLKALFLHSDLKADDRFFWFTTTGWMMWNFLIGGLLLGTTVVCYDGDPMWPDENALWRLAREVAITYFGTSAPYIEACRRAGCSPRSLGELKVHSVGSTGAPLSPEGFVWAAREIADDVLVGSVSGGTDVCTAFLASCPWLEVRSGELQCRALGAKVEAYDEEGRPVLEEVGELVVTEAMPSMPVALWGDDGTRLHDAYFAYFPGVWRHGDWVKITSRGSAVVYGRSDATLNRAGVRMGTAEFYRIVESLPEVADALVVDTTELGRAGELVLFVVPAAAAASGGLSDDQEREIRAALRDRLSPRHVPDRIISLRALPRTINGKKLEVPVRKILLGAAPEQAASAGALSDPSALDELVRSIAEAGLR